MTLPVKTIASDPGLVAFCGLYCGACRAYLRKKCPGCQENSRADWCKIRACCSEGHLATCAECRQYENPHRCGKFNNIISKLFGLIFRSDRAACIRQIRALGIQEHADRMAASGCHTLRK